MLWSYKPSDNYFLVQFYPERSWTMEWLPGEVKDENYITQFMKMIKFKIMISFQ